jgi:hypothetical protein
LEGQSRVTAELPLWRGSWLSFEEVVVWMRREDQIPEALVERFIAQHATAEELDPIVRAKLDRRSDRPIRSLFDAYYLVVTGRVSLHLVEQIHAGLVAGGHYRQVQKTLRLTGRLELTAAEIETMARAYHAIGTYSYNDDASAYAKMDDRYFGRLIKSLPQGQAKRELKQWVKAQQAQRPKGSDE